MFRPAGPGGDWKHNAVRPHRETDALLGFGFVSLAETGVRDWKDHGPNDLHLMPIILNFRHGIELLLKESIREAARCRRRDGDFDPALARAAVDAWLSQKAGHSLETLANRLDVHLAALGAETLPADTRQVLSELHQLDPRGDTFRYAAGWDGSQQAHVPSARPNETHIDIDRLGERLSNAANLIGGGVLTILELHSDMQDELEAQAY
ncbi:MAG: hypothetical protein JWP02_3599 [Acidimicrobiales bacterium]|nr:hypothetical protein [Acidimicrobiales bacterium]